MSVDGVFAEHTYVAGASFAGSQRGKIAGALEKVWKMPSLYGLALALVVRAGGRPVPEAIMRPVDLLSDAALPVMILVLGMQLEQMTSLIEAISWPDDALYI